MSAPLISICIPTYRRGDLLQRLLENLCAQSFRDFEVVITDNTEEGDAVEAVAASFKGRLPIRYFRNVPTVSMGENWNRCLSLAGGEWLKMIHDDDWFSTPDSLQAFADAARNAAARFIFSAYYLADAATSEKELRQPAASGLARLRRNVLYLAASNVVGPPSTTMIRRDALQPFKALKWMVDVEGYIRILQQSGDGFIYLDQPLISIQRHEGQATQAYFRNPAVEIPENLALLEAQPQLLRYYFGYDHFWRLLRNMNIRSEAMLRQYAGDLAVPQGWTDMQRTQKLLPKALLLKGPFSKVAMSLSYLKYLAGSTRQIRR